MVYSASFSGVAPSGSLLVGHLFGVLQPVSWTCRAKSADQGFSLRTPQRGPKLKARTLLKID